MTKGQVCTESIRLGTTGGTLGGSPWWRPPVWAKKAFATWASIAKSSLWLQGRVQFGERPSFSFQAGRSSQSSSCSQEGASAAQLYKKGSILFCFTLSDHRKRVQTPLRMMISSWKCNLIMEAIKIFPSGLVCNTVYWHIVYKGMSLRLANSF